MGLNTVWLRYFKSPQFPRVNHS